MGKGNGGKNAFGKNNRWIPGKGGLYMTDEVTGQCDGGQGWHEEEEGADWCFHLTDDAHDKATDEDDYRRASMRRANEQCKLHDASVGGSNPILSQHNMFQPLAEEDEGAIIDEPWPTPNSDTSRAERQLPTLAEFQRERETQRKVTNNLKKKEASRRRRKHDEMFEGMTETDGDRSMKDACMMLGHEAYEELHADHLAAINDNEGRWMRIDAAIDSGAVDSVINRECIPHIKVWPTPESERGESWTGVGGESIRKEGQVILNWFTDQGNMKRSRFKVGRVKRTLISVSKLNEFGFDARLGKTRPHLFNEHTGEVIELKKDRGMFVLPLWVWRLGDGTMTRSQGFPGQP